MPFRCATGLKHCTPGDIPFFSGLGNLWIYPNYTDNILAKNIGRLSYGVIWIYTNCCILQFYSTLQYGLQLCDRESAGASVWCRSSKSSFGSRDGSCYPYDLWTVSKTEEAGYWAHSLNTGVIYEIQRAETFAFSVRSFLFADLYGFSGRSSKAGFVYGSRACARLTCSIFLK